MCVCDVTVSTAIFYIQSMAYLLPFCEEKGELVEFTHCRRGGFWLRVDSSCLARNSCSKNRCREMGRKRPCFPLRVGVPIMMWHHVKTMNTRLNFKKHTHTQKRDSVALQQKKVGPQRGIHCHVASQSEMIIIATGTAALWAIKRNMGMDEKRDYFNG